ncbi:sulfurtransferase [Ralstonia flaminis]|jgi:thiosulfate/3-mercaptopyruvate sulfurtransferase|uniref:Sulfurtransferase n=1 Tax=Ralstonia flaminis TaxID=3058597 RepID=A0ABM9JZ58_9RALS|nr:sulfurtransferase [Ralstonia sp. LMG 18101]CAJ0807644.1 Putative thiosulfate sulfurtransferase SseB [Ralstonia sp. LMG 18101]
MSERARYATLMTAAQLAALQQSAPNTLVIVDCSFDLANPAAGRDAYHASHIPGAFYLHLDNELSGPKTGTNGRHPLPDADALVARLQALGVNDDTQVVAYDRQGGMYAARLWWLLRWVGHADVAVLDGGLQAWEAAHYPVNKIVPDEPQLNATPGKLTRKPSLAALVNADIVQKYLGHTDKPVIDARAPDRYRGENETLDPVGGHIPGARNRFFRDNLQADGTFKSAEQLRADFAAVLAGAKPADTMLQCGSGVTACHNALAMEIAGLTGAALYAGSWSEWCSDPARPVATGPNP